MKSFAVIQTGPGTSYSASSSAKICHSFLFLASLTLANSRGEKLESLRELCLVGARPLRSFFNSLILFSAGRSVKLKG